MGQLLVQNLNETYFAKELKINNSVTRMKLLFSTNKN